MTTTTTAAERLARMISAHYIPAGRKPVLEFTTVLSADLLELLAKNKQLQAEVVRLTATVNTLDAELNEAENALEDTQR